MIRHAATDSAAGDPAQQATISGTITDAETDAGPSRPPLSRPRPRPRRLPPSGSFHAGAPFPQLSPGLSRSATSSARRKSTLASTTQPDQRPSASNTKYHTFPTPPLGTPVTEQPPSTRFGVWRARAFWPRRSPRHGGRRSQTTDGTWSGSEDGQMIARGSSSEPEHEDDDYDHDGEEHAASEATPLPWKQLGLLALLSLAEQTALNSIGPYLPTMVAGFPEIPEGEEGLYVGLLASAFALAQLTTNLFWGYLSDRIGRKPVMLLGTALLMVCFTFFGFCTNYAQLITVHVAMGLLNGNAAVVPTCLGEVTDRSNQSRAFIWLPVIYSLGSITGPALGGLLVGILGGEKRPYLAPNLLDAGLLLLSVLVLGIWFEETLDRDAAESGATVLPGWLQRFLKWFKGSSGKSDLDQNEADGNTPRDGSGSTQAVAGSGRESTPLLNGSDPHKGNDVEDHDSEQLDEPAPKLTNRNTMAILATYLVFQLANISFNSLYPIFVSAPPPTGRELGPSTIGLSLSLAGLATILFQVFVFQSLKEKMGNLATYRYSLLGMALSMALMPWIGYLTDAPWLGIGTGPGWLYAEMGSILVIKNVCAVGGLSSVMLLITNSAPSHETLGTLNGIAQTLSAAGRSVGPFLSGGLFTLSTRVMPKGEALAWGLFAGVTLCGWAGSLVIRGQGLESAEWKGEAEESEAEDADVEDNIPA